MSQSLMSQHREAEGLAPIAESLNLPAVVSGGEVAVNPRQFSLSPYVVFAEPRSSSWLGMAAVLPDLEAGDPVLVRQDPEPPLALTPFRFSLIESFPYYAMVDQSGEIQAATLNPDEARANKNYRESIEAVVYVFLPCGGVIPARCTFKTVKCGAIHRAKAAIDLAQTTEWARLSPDHALTMRVPDPRLRLTAKVLLQPRTSKRWTDKDGNPQGGYKYVAADAQIRPASIGDMQAIADLHNDPDTSAALASIRESHDRRVNEVKSKIR